MVTDPAVTSPPTGPGTSAHGATLGLTTADLLPLRPGVRAITDPQHRSFCRYVEGRWQDVTAREHLAGLGDAARGLLASGIEPGDRVALMSGTRYEWLLLDEAIWAAGAVTVPIYPSSAPSQVEWVLTDSGARLVLVETPEQAAAVAELGVGVEVLTIDDGALEELRRRGVGVTDPELVARREALDLDSIATIVYTSGTTGRPKGVVLTHRQLAAEAAAILAHPAGAPVVKGSRVLMFLPLAHVLARAVTHAAAQGGATLGFWSDMSTLDEALATFEPDLVLGVPRVFEKLHEAARRSAADSGRAGRRLFGRAEETAIAWSRAKGEDGRSRQQHPGPRLVAEHALYDRLVYRRIRAALGGRLAYAISGGGAMPERLGHFFRGIGVPVYEGYGLTESCAAITVNGPGCQRIGTVGRPLAGNEVRIADSGEIQLRGPVVMREYWQAPEATAAVLDEQGWLSTGDLGILDGGYLTITGRAKEIIVTAGGKNVVPGPMEDLLRTHPLVANAMVVGEGRPFVGALVTLDPVATTRWAGEHGLAGRSLAEIAASPELLDELQPAVDVANAPVSRAERIRCIRVLADDFTEERGEVTATLKLRRAAIERGRAADLEALYSS